MKTEMKVSRKKQNVVVSHIIVSHRYETRLATSQQPLERRVETTGKTKKYRRHQEESKIGQDVANARKSRRGTQRKETLDKKVDSDVECPAAGDINDTKNKEGTRCEEMSTIPQRAQSPSVPKRTTVMLDEVCTASNIIGSSESKLRNAKKHWITAVARDGSGATRMSDPVDAWGQCRKLECQNNAEHGAHVKIPKLSLWNWYIVPLCQRCNPRSSGAVFQLKRNTIAVQDTKASAWTHIKSWKHHLPKVSLKKAVGSFFGRWCKSQ